jgi:hypothetical protein
MGTITPARVVPSFWNPSDDGFLGANGDYANCSGGGAAIAGTLYLARLPVRSPQLISTLWPLVAVLGVGASTGTFCGLYSPANPSTGIANLLSGSPDQGTNFTGTTGEHAATLNTPSMVGGSAVSTWPYAAVLCNLATTQVSLERFLNTNIAANVQVNLNAATQRWGSIAAVGTALPSTVNLSTMAVTAFTYAWLWS